MIPYSENIFLRNHSFLQSFSLIFLPEEALFRIKETDLEVQTDFLTSKNHFLYIFSETPTGESFFSV